MAEPKPKFNIKAVTLETGLSPEILHAWERRYGLPRPKRTPGGHRLYTQREVDILKWLVARQKEGLSISRAVDLWRTLEANGQDPLVSNAVTQPGIRLTGTTLDELRQNWVECCLAFDEITAEHTLAQAFAMFSPDIACIEVLQKGLSDIGKNWYNNSGTIQQEHFATALAVRRLDALISSAPQPSRPERILAACPPGEEHTFGLLLITYLVRRRGIDVVYLGANVSLLHLETTLRTTEPRLTVALAQTLPAAAALRDMAEFLKNQAEPLAYGGGIFETSPALQKYIPALYLGIDFAKAAGDIEQILNVKPRMPRIDPVPPEYIQAKNEYVKIRPALEAMVNDVLSSQGLRSDYMEIANHSLFQHLEAALSLGNLQLMDDSVQWIYGLLEKHGPSPENINRYLGTYWQALKALSKGKSQIILDWFAARLENS
jgi:DNA-binding transcriptional MerR regulator